MIEESPVTAQTIWTGSDDGKVYLTRNGGVKWTDVTPKDMAKYTRVSSVDASKFGECIAYVAANRFQLDDDKPYLWKTSDCGAHWTRIDAGINATEFTRVVREDPGKRGLLVAGTERGVWYSADDGANWRSLRLNLPIVPVHDLVFKEGDIVLATHGRGFYIMDDIYDARADDDGDRRRERAPVQAARSVSVWRPAADSAAAAAAAAERRRRSRPRTLRSIRRDRIRRQAWSSSTGSARRTTRSRSISSTQRAR